MTGRLTREHAAPTISFFPRSGAPSVVRRTRPRNGLVRDSKQCGLRTSPVTILPPSKPCSILSCIVEIEIDVQARYSAISKLKQVAETSVQGFCLQPKIFLTFYRVKFLQPPDSRLKERKSNCHNRAECTPRTLRIL